MSNSTHASVLHTPELVMLIAKYLTPKDISMVMRASKYMFQMLEPLLWRHVTIVKSDLITENSLRRNLLHIHTLHIVSCFRRIAEILVGSLPPMELGYTTTPKSPLNLGASSPAIASTLNLQNIIISNHHAVANSHFEVVSIISHSHRLVRLHLPTTVLYDDTARFLDVLSDDLPQLRILSICEDYRDVRLSTATQLLEACFQHPQLTELRCGFNINDEDYITQKLSTFLLSIIERKDDLDSTLSKITSIELPRSKRYLPSVLLRFLRDFLPNLERVVFPPIGILDDNVLGVLTETWCPNLQHVSCLLRCRHTRDFIIPLLTRCFKGIGLKSFHSHSLHDDRPELESSLVETLLKYHSETLEDIEIMDFISLKPGDLRNILMTCKKLERLRIVASDDFQSKYVAMLSGEWVCTSLKELALVLPLECVKREYDELGDEDEPWMVTSLFKQIGRLVKLETLCLGLRDDYFGDKRQELAFTDNRLTELANLANLRQFYVLKNNWPHVGQMEVEFMHEHWPRLEKISLSQNFYNYRRKTPPHWTWLKKQRPKLTVDFETFVFSGFEYYHQ
ncbi:hypothetical protein BGX26_005053 [Mortierella sp. AD094]|nr:hypothetical protein BGX26_005053 [Mortierella sp. AD094]